MSTRPFRVLGVQQIAIGGPSKAPLRRLWVELLGAEPLGAFRSETENVDEDIVGVGEGAGLVEIDLMQPIDPEKSPKVHQPALNHIGLWVDDLAAGVASIGLADLEAALAQAREASGGTPRTIVTQVLHVVRDVAGILDRAKVRLVLERDRCT